MIVKADLHRHIGGSISYKTVHALLKKQNPQSQITESDVMQTMVYNENDQRTFKNFFSRFRLLDEIKWDEEALTYMLNEVCWDISREKIDHVELKFTVDKYLRNQSWSIKELITLIYDIINHQCVNWDLSIDLVLSVKYESDRNFQRKIIKLIEDPDICTMLAGVDLVGDEYYYDANFYRDILKDWKNAKKGIEAHVGESQSGENVRTAIEVLGVDRIAHGINAAKSADILAIAKERDICFDVALTSNYMTGAVHNIGEHPIKDMHGKVSYTIGTDDPAILNTTLDNEYSILQNILKLSDDELYEIMNNSIKYAFNRNLLVRT